MVNIGGAELDLGFSKQSITAAIRDVQNVIRRDGKIQFAPVISQADISVTLGQLQAQVKRNPVDIPLKIDADSIRGGRELSQALQRFRTPIEIPVDVDVDQAQIRRQGSVIAGIFQGIGQQLFQTVAQSISVLTAATGEFIKTSFEADRTTRQWSQSLAGLLGSDAAADSAIVDITNTANKFGQDVTAIVDGYTKITASAQSTGIEQRKVNEFFEEFARVGGIRGLDQQQSDLSLRAITQVVEKNQLLSEELRGQLSESFSGATGILADGLGVEVEELNQLLKDGAINGEVFLDAFTRGLANVQGEIDPVLVGLGQFQNQLFAIQQGIGEALRPLQGAGLTAINGILDGAGDTASLDPITEAAEELTAILEANPELLVEIGAGFGEIASIVVGELADAISFVSNLIKENPELIQSSVDRMVALAEAADTVVRAVAGLSTLIATASARFSIFSSAKDDLSLVEQAFKGIFFNLRLILDPLGTVADGIDRVRGLLEGLGGVAIEPIDGDLAGSAADAVQAASDAITAAQANILGSTSDATDGFREQADAAKALEQAQNSLATSLSGLDTAKANAAAGFAEQRTALLASGADQGQLDALNQQILASDQQLAKDRIAILTAGKVELERLQASDPSIASEAGDQLIKIEQQIARARESAAKSAADRIEAIEKARVDAQKKALEDLVDANEQAASAIEQAQSQQLRANRSRLLEGASEEDVAAERIAIEQRSTQALIAEYERQKRSLQAAVSEGSIDAQAGADERFKIEADLGKALDALLEQQIEAQQQAIERQVANISQQYAGLASELEAQQGNLSIRGDLVSGQVDLLEAQRNLQSAIADGAKSELDARIAIASANGDVVTQARLQVQAVQAQGQGLRNSLNFEKQTLGLKQQQRRISAEEKTLQAQINELKAEEALLTAQAEKASASQLAVLQKQLDLSRRQSQLAQQQFQGLDQLDQLDNDLLTQSFENQFDQIENDARLAGINIGGSLADGISSATSPIIQDLREQIDSLTDVQNGARSGIAGALGGNLGLDQGSAQDTLANIQTNFQSARGAGLLQGEAGSEFRQALQQVEQLVNSNANTTDLLRAASQQQDNQFFTSLLDQVGLGGIAGLVEADQEFALADAQIKGLEAKIDGVTEAINALPDSLPQGIGTVQIATPDPVADVGLVLDGVAQQKRRGVR